MHAREPGASRRTMIVGGYSLCVSSLIFQFFKFSSQEEHRSADLNPDAALPTGWHGVMSHSRPGEIVYARSRLQEYVVA